MCDVPQTLLFAKGATTSVTVKTELPQYLDAPVQQGMKVGSVSLYTSGGKIKEYPIIVAETVEKIDFVKALTILTEKVCTL